jgi:hypothetical protein
VASHSQGVVVGLRTAFASYLDFKSKCVCVTIMSSWRHPNGTKQNKKMG